MIAFTRVLDIVPGNVLLVAMNIAIAATIIAALALIASGLRGISFPVRHAICVCGAAGAIMAPLLVVSLARWTPGFAEIIFHELPSEKRQGSEHLSPRRKLSQDITYPSAPDVEHSTTISHAIAGTRLPDSLNSAYTETPTLSPAAASLNSPELPPNGSHDPSNYRLILCKLMVLVWLVGSIVLFLQRVLAEIRLRRWLLTCDPVADVETLNAAQSAAHFVGKNQQSSIRRLAVQFRLRRWLAQRSQIPEAETLEAAHAAATAVGLFEPPFLLRSKTLPAPVVWGVFHPRLILPEAMASGAGALSHNQRTAVLTHEMAHLARRDLVTGLFLTIARIVYWWNPMVCMLCRRTEDLGEQICDDFATASLSQPREYASALLHFAECSAGRMPRAASVGLSGSAVSQLEIRVRRILNSSGSKSLRVSATACVIIVLMTTVLAVAASMIQIRAAADEKSPFDDNGAFVQEKRPTLNELLTKIETMETACMPFHFSVTETMRVNEELTPEQRIGVRYADGQVHKRLLEHAMLERKIWFRSEASETDGVKGSTSLSYADGNRNVQFQPDRGIEDVYINENTDDLMWFEVNSPLTGVFPLSNRSDGNLFLSAVRNGKCNPTLTWDGENAVLNFSHGEPSFYSDYQWTLSRKHDWHPVRLKTWLARNEYREQISDWMATDLQQDNSGVWRVKKGSLAYFNWEQKPRLTTATGEPMPYYVIDFRVESAAYGDAVDREKFKYEISEDASIRNSEKAKAKMPTIIEDRELLITVVNANDEPIGGAKVRTSTGDFELETFTTDASGQVTSKKRGIESVSIQTEAPGYRPTTTGVGGAPLTLRIVMLPTTEMTVIDEDGKPLEGIFVSTERFASMNLEFDRNGFPIGPNSEFTRDPKGERTDINGHFQLTNDITLRTLKDPVPIWAVSDNGDRFGWMWVSPAELDQTQTLVLRRTAFVEAAFLIKQQTRETVYSWSLLDSSGFCIAGVAPNVSSFGTNAFCNLRFRLPPGDYFLRREIPNGNPATSVFAFKVESNQQHADLGLVEELSDAIDIDSEWGSVYGRIQVTNPDSIDFRPKVLVPAGALANNLASVLSEDMLVDPQTGGLEGAFVYLASAPTMIHPATARAPFSPLVFDQVGGRFVPHLMIVRVGQSIECVNTSPIAASVHIYPLKNQALNIPLRPLTKPGTGHLWTPKNSEKLPIRVASDFHPWMQAYWLALDHPYAAITDKQGRFVIQNLPPGNHIVKVWHERVGYIERKMEFTIEPGQITAQPAIPVDAAGFLVR